MTVISYISQKYYKMSPGVAWCVYKHKHVDFHLVLSYNFWDGSRNSSQHCTGLTVLPGCIAILLGEKSVYHQGH